MSILFRLSLSFLLLLQCAFLWGSDFVLHSKLSESEANDIIFVLLSKGISAQKSSAKDGFSVVIDKKMAAKSMKVLRGHGLPHGEFTNLGKAFANDGLVSSPSQENIKYIHAVSQEIEEAISHIDGVMVVRVSLVVAKQNSFGDEISPASASIFIKYHPDYDMTSNVPKIKQLVSNSVANLDYSRVAVALFEAADFDLSEVPEEENNNLLAIISVLAIIFGLYWWFFRNNGNKKGTLDPSIIAKKNKKGDIFELIDNKQGDNKDKPAADNNEDPDLQLKLENRV